MNAWKSLANIDDVNEAIKASHNIPSLLFKHSTRCPISDIAFLRLKDDWKEDAPLHQIYYLDLISHREVSNYIAEHLEVHHESPQVILIKNGRVVFDSSHMDIRTEELSQQLA